MKNIYSLFGGLVVVSLVSLGLLSCGSSSGSSIGAPELEPPATGATPAGFISTSSSILLRPDSAARYAIDADVVSTLRERIFSIGSDAGPSAYRERLDLVDGRMASLDRRAQETEKECLAEDAALYEYPEVFSFPGGVEFPIYLQCFEELSDDLQMAFGIRNEVFYLIEIQQSGDSGVIIVIASAPLSGTGVEAWTLTIADDGATAGAQYVSADESSNAITMNYAAGDANDGTSCGVFMRSNGEYVYFNADFNDTSGSGSGCAGKTALCLNAETLEDADPASSCEDADLDSTPSGVTQFEGSDTAGFLTGFQALKEVDLSGISAF